MILKSVIAIMYIYIYVGRGTGINNGFKRLTLNFARRRIRFISSLSIANKLFNFLNHSGIQLFIVLLNNRKRMMIQKWLMYIYLKSTSDEIRMMRIISS